MAQLTPVPKFRAVGSDGLALVGGKLYAYTAGTSTPKDTYTSYTLGTANTNPVILDARGEADVWLNGSYKLTLKDSLDVQIWSVDDVRDLTSSQTFASPTFSGTATFTGTAVTWSGNPTHSGNHTWSGNHLFNGNVTVGDAGADSFTVTPNAVTWTNNPTHSGAHTWSGVQTFSATPAGKITSSTYTPTFTGVANVTGTPTASGTWKWIRIGNVVTYSGAVTVNVTAGTALTELRGTLPVASAIAATTDLSGTVNMPLTYPSSDASVIGDVANDQMDILFTCSASTGSRVIRVFAQYEVL
jgi:hypothetical protein